MLTSPRRLGRFSAKNWTGVRVLLPEAIRQVGVYTVPLRLSRNVTADVEVVVVDVEAPEGVEDAAEALVAEAAAAEAGAEAGVDTPDLTNAEDVPEPGYIDDSQEPAAEGGPADDVASGSAAPTGFRSRRSDLTRGYRSAGSAPARTPPQRGRVTAS